MVLHVLVGLAVLAGLTWGFYALWFYLQDSPSPADYRETQAKLARLTALHEVSRIEDATRRRLYEAALAEMRHGPS